MYQSREEAPRLDSNQQDLSLTPHQLVRQVEELLAPGLEKKARGSKNIYDGRYVYSIGVVHWSPEADSQTPAYLYHEELYRELDAESRISTMLAMALPGGVLNVNVKLTPDTYCVHRLVTILPEE